MNRGFDRGRVVLAGAQTTDGRNGGLHGGASSWG
jgi:hypothetical protein